MQTAKIGRGGQINIPRDIREYLELEPGHFLGFSVEDGKVVLRPLTKTLRNFRGAVPVDGPQDLEAVRSSALQARAEERAKPHD